MSGASSPGVPEARAEPSPAELARQQVAEIESIYAYAPIGLCVLDRDLRWVRINERLAEMNGYPVAAHLGRRVHDLLPDIAAQAEALLARVLATGEPVLDLEVIGETPARPGERRVWREHFLPLRDETGEITGLNVVCEEITQRRTLEDRLAERLTLERAARGRAARLHAIGAALSGATTLDAVADVLARAAALALGAHAALVVLRASAALRPRVAALVGYDRAAHGTPPDAALHWLLGAATREFASDADWLAAGAPAALDAGAPPVGARLLLPLADGREVLGALLLGFPGGLASDETERTFAREIADEGARALFRARLLHAAETARTQLDSVLSAAPVGFAVLDAALRFVTVNEALARMDGVPRGAHVGRPLPEAVPALAPLAPHVAQAFGAGSAPLGVELAVPATPHEPDGGIWQVSVFPIAGHAGGEAPPAVGLVCEDVTARRQAEQDREFLLQLSARLQVEHDPEAMLVAALELLAAQLGAARAAVVERGTGEAPPAGAAAASDGPGEAVMDAREAPDGVPVVREWRAAALPPLGVHAAAALLPLRPGLPYAAVAVENAAEDARTAPGFSARLAPAAAVSLLLVALPDDEERGTATLVLAGEAPRAWSRRATGLAHAAAERLWPAVRLARAHRAAEAARVEAERASRAKSDFLRTMSHELRTPLNAIAGYTELLALGIRGPVTEEQQEDLRRIQRNQQHLLGLINAVLNFARLEAGRVDFAREEIAVAALLHALEPLVAPQLAAKALRYRCLTPPEELRVLADPEKVSQILLNLLSNAIKFTPPGGTVTVEGRHVPPTPDGGAAVVELAVRDTGHGIPAERLHDIFDPFVQVDASLTRSREGSGLGLAISRELARGMQGELRAASAPGRGSVFTLVLPAPSAAS